MAIWSRAAVGLPTVTIARARQAKLDGDPGLVYHRLPAGHSESLRPSATFTKHHRLAMRTGITDCYNELDVLLMVGYHTIPIYTALGIGRVVTGLCE